MQDEAQLSEIMFRKRFNAKSVFKSKRNSLLELPGNKDKQQVWANWLSELKINAEIRQEIEGNKEKKARIRPKTSESSKKLKREVVIFMPQAEKSTQISLFETEPSPKLKEELEFSPPTPFHSTPQASSLRPWRKYLSHKPRPASKSLLFTRLHLSHSHI